MYFLLNMGDSPLLCYFSIGDCLGCHLYHGFSWVEFQALLPGALVKYLIRQLHSQLLSLLVALLRTFFAGITWTDFLWWWFIRFFFPRNIGMWCTRIYTIYIYLSQYIFDVTSRNIQATKLFLSKKKQVELIHPTFTASPYWSHVTHGDMDNAMDNVSLGPGPAWSSRRRCQPLGFWQITSLLPW